MKLEQIEDIIAGIQGVTFAALDAKTEPLPGIFKLTTGEVVLLYNTKGVSGYESMVKRRLLEVGKDPAAFVVGELPFGERVNGPLIVHNGKYYLQTVLVKKGEVRAFIGKTEINPASVPEVLSEKDVMRSAARQGLPVEKAVIVRCYRLDHILELRLQHMKITAENIAV